MPSWDAQRLGGGGVRTLELRMRRVLGKLIPLVACRQESTVKSIRTEYKRDKPHDTCCLRRPAALGLATYRARTTDANLQWASIAMRESAISRLTCCLRLESTARGSGEMKQTPSSEHAVAPAPAELTQSWPRQHDRGRNARSEEGAGIGKWELSREC